MRASMIVLWLCLSGLAQENVAVDVNEVKEVPLELASPRATMRTFLTAMVEVKNGDSSALSQAVSCLDLSQIDPLLRGSLGKKAAEDVSMCIDRIAFVVFEDIPEVIQGQWVFSKARFEYQGARHEGLIAIGVSEDGCWKFTPETVAGIGTYRAFLLDRAVVEGVQELETWETRWTKRFPWLGNRTFLLLNIQWVLMLAIILLAILVERLVNLSIKGLANRWLKRIHSNLTDKEARSLRLPFRIVSYAVVLNFGIHLTSLNSFWTLIAARVVFVSLSVGLLWAALNIIDLVATYFHKLASRTENRFDDLLIPLLHKSAKVVITLLAFLFVAQAMGSNLAALLTGLGIGGLALALAAKDTLANLFGSITVLLDRPFQIGDWICMGKVEGTVEEVGFRSTRVRTFYDSVISVPNSNLTNSEIDNYGRRSFRRFTTKIGITYDTPPECIEAFCEGIRQIIIAHQWTRKDYFHVYLNNMATHSLEILLYVFWQVPDWSKELLEKHRLLLDILRLGESLNVSFAFPTQTLHLYQEEHAARLALDQDPQDVGLTAAQAITNNPMTSSEPRSVAVDGKLPDVVNGL